MLNKRRFRRYFESNGTDTSPVKALKDLQYIAEEYDKLNRKFSEWFEKYDKVSNGICFSIEDVLKNKYGEVPLMFRYSRSVDDELENERSLEDNFDEIIDVFYDSYV